MQLQMSWEREGERTDEEGLKWERDGGSFSHAVGLCQHPCMVAKGTTYLS